ncbi:MAG: S1C family serine protease [Gemmataceae bacterium]|nr:S1C family serine protease [Gemmataceae bacterium]
MKRFVIGGALAVMIAALPGPAQSDESSSKVADEVNLKMVKLFGAGGFRGLESYAAGAIIDKEGHVLTVNSHILETRDLRVHMHDGNKRRAKVVAREPELDIALVKIDFGAGKPDIEAWFDFDAAAKREPAKAGTTVLGFTNMFQLALRDDPMTIQNGVVSSYSKLYGRMGVFDAAYRGNIYVIDAIVSNPGSGGGVIVNRKGELLGLVGKELRNELTNTWINYAIPMNAVTEVIDKEGKKVKASIADVVRLKDKYKPVPKKDDTKRMLVYHGLILVPNVVERTPPYVEEVAPDSPAAKTEPKPQPDDLIVYVDGIPVPDINTFNNVLAGYGPGSDVKFEIQRGDKLITVPIKLAKAMGADATTPKK